MKNEVSGKLTTTNEAIAAAGVYVSRMKSNDRADFLARAQEMLRIHPSWEKVKLPSGFSVVPAAGQDAADITKHFFGSAIAKAAALDGEDGGLAAQRTANDPHRRHALKNGELAATMRVFASVTGVPMSEAYHRLAGLSEIKNGGR